MANGRDSRPLAGGQGQASHGRGRGGSPALPSPVSGRPATTRSTAAPSSSMVISPSAHLLAELDHLGAREGVLEMHRAKPRDETPVAVKHGSGLLGVVELSLVLLVAIEHGSVRLVAIGHGSILISAAGAPTGSAGAFASVRALIVVTMRDRLPITFTLDGEPVESVTHLARSGPYVLVLQTVMPQSGLAVELHSTFIRARRRSHAGHPSSARSGRPASPRRSPARTPRASSTRSTGPTPASTRTVTS